MLKTKNIFKVFEVMNQISKFFGLIDHMKIPFEMADKSNTKIF